MANLRPYLTEIGQSIVSEHLDSGVDLNDLVVKHANDKQLNDSSTQMLVGITNKEYLKKTNYQNQNFKMAKVEDVYDKLYSKPKTHNTTKVAYTYPEFEDSIETRMAKVASVDIDLAPKPEETPFELGSTLRKLAGESLGEVRSKLSGLYQETQDLHEKVAGNIAVLKTLGYTRDEIDKGLVEKEASVETRTQVGMIYDACDKVPRGSGGFNQHQIEAYFNGVVEAGTELAEKTASYVETNKDFERAKQAHKIVGAQRSVLF
jgi:hypothetical protein